MMDTTKPRIGLQWALLPILLTFIVLGIQLFVFDTFTPHVPLVLGIGIAALVGRLNGTSWKDMRRARCNGFRLACRPSVILSWAASLPACGSPAARKPTRIT